MHRDVERTRIFELLKLTDQLAARQTPRRLALLRSLLKTLKHHQATVPTSSIFGVQFAGVMEALRSLPLARRSPALRRAISRLAHQPAVIEMAAAANIEPAHSAKTLRMAVDMVLGNVRQVQQMLRAPLSVVQKRLAELQGKPRTATFAKCDEIFAMLPSSAVVAHVMQRLTEGGMFKVAIDLHDAFVSTFASVTALAASTHNQSKTALLKFSTQQEACGLAMDMKTAIKVRRATDLLQTSTDRLKFMLASAPTNELLTPLLVALGHAQDASRVMVELTRYRTLFKAEPRMHLEAAAALALGGTPVRQALEVLPSLQALTSSTELVLSLLRCAVREHDLDSCARIIQGSGLVQLLETASTRSDLETIASSPPRNDLTAISRAMHDMHHVRNVDYLPGNASTSPSRQTLSAAVTEVIRAFRMALAYSVEAKPAMASHPALVAMSEAERELFSCLHKLTARAPNAAQQEQSPASVHALLQLSLSPPVLRAFGSAQASELLLTMPRSALSRLATSFVDISPAAVQQQLADAGLLPATVALLYHQAGRLIEESSQAAAATVAGLNARLHHHRPPQQDTSAMVTAIFSLVSTLYHQFTPLSSRKARTTGSSLQAHLQDSVAFATLATSLRMVMVAESRRFQSAVSRSADAALRLPLSSLSPSAIDTLLREGGSVEHLFSPIVDGATLGQIVPAPSEQSQLFDDCQLPLEPWRTNALAYPSHLFRTSYALAAVMTRTILPQIHWRVDAHRQMANTMIALHADAGSVVTAIRLTISALREGVQVQPHAFAAVLRATATVPSANPNSQRLAEIIVTHIWPSMNNAMQDVPHMSRPFLSAVTSPRFDQHVSTTKSSVASPHQPIAPPLAHAAALSPIKEAAAAPFNQTARTDTEPRPLLSSLAAAGASSFGPDRIDDLSLMQGVVTPGPAQSLGAVSTYVQRADVSLQLGRYAAGALGDFFKCCARINRPTEAYLASLSRQFDGALNPRIFDALLAGLNEANDAEGFAATLAYMHRCGVAIGLQAHLQIVKHYVATPAVADQMIHRLLSGTSVAVRVSGDASELTVAAQIAFASKAADSETAGSIPAAQQQPASPAARVSHELATADWYMDLVATGVSAWLRADQPSAAARLVLTSLPNLPSFVSRSALLTQLADLTSSTSASGRTFANELTLALCSNPMLVPARAVHTWQHHFEAQLSEETLAALARSRK
ncbi:hypothetical protein CAOG_01677 [Capsaspora owczarzaki ATCC 30864]|uniref:Uncharacterized protein n=1 Tax=Capsaspora owczarzaki (strain ATCC 30864) TaxID=595528 RepID=A0A0D2X182_CAPO3|nr:hypothetical protein CAOG_01677 [Capsaspora owczarzaki ATCC 30864]KJE90354.1 hypothetical protein CAOG_001677 [Capsaspora owczarzaki ATCC 30864]|eukprot:XP_004364545.2 hypothetical protein CAOG_01677 [Capsaspora owczarzaki ATCC 30864]